MNCIRKFGLRISVGICIIFCNNIYFYSWDEVAAVLRQLSDLTIQFAIEAPC